jgi:hypothetical protein
VYYHCTSRAKKEQSRDLARQGRVWTMFGSPDTVRTCDQQINSLLLYQLSYWGIIFGGTLGSRTLSAARHHRGISNPVPYHPAHVPSCYYIADTHRCQQLFGGPREDRTPTRGLQSHCAPIITISPNYLAYPLGLEPRLTVLETAMLPLHYGYLIWCRPQGSNLVPRCFKPLL